MDIHEVEADPELKARAEAERVEFSNGVVRPFVVELANRGRVRAEEWAIPMSGPERELLVPHLETEVFLQHYEHCLRNCSRRDGISYDDAVINELSPEAIRRIRELVLAVVTRELHWEPVAQKSEVLASQLREIRTETTRLTRLITFVINWCAESPEDEKPGPFRRNTYADGVRYAKDAILRRVLGRLEPAGAGEETSDGFMGVADFAASQMARTIREDSKRESEPVSAYPLGLLNLNAVYGKLGVPRPMEVELAHASEVAEELARTRRDTTERQEERKGLFRLLGDVRDMLQHELRVIHRVAERDATVDGATLVELVNRVEAKRAELIRSVVGGGVS